MRITIDWYAVIAQNLRDYSDGEIWSSGDEILCKTESAAEAISDMIWQLYRAQGESVVLTIGYYDPEKDRQSGQEDRFTGWWYVDID